MASSNLDILNHLFPEQNQSSKATLATLQVVYNRFNLSNDFSYNHAFLNRIVFILEQGLSNEVHIKWNNFDNFSLKDIWLEWHRSSKEALNRYLDYKGEDPRLNFKIKAKPAKCLMQRIQADFKPQQDGILLLYIAFMMIPISRSSKFNAEEITQLLTKAPFYDDHFLSLPLGSFSNNKTQFLSDLTEKCETLIKRPDIGDKYQIFYRRLHELSLLFLTGGHKHKHLKRTSLEDASFTDSTKSKTTAHSTATLHTNEQEYPPGYFSMIISGDDPEPIKAVTEIMNTTVTAEERFPQNIVEAELEVGSKYWVQNYSSSIPWNSNGINPLTKKYLLRHLEANPTKISLIFYLMLGTGLKLSSLLELEFSWDGDLTPNGLLKRIYTPPEKHFIPETDMENILQPTSNVFYIQLPKVIVNLLGQFKISSTKKITFGDALNLSESEAKAQTSKIIESLISEGATGLARNRIHMSLRKHISMMTKDDFIGYLLTSRSSEAAPVSSYYTRISQEQLQLVYNLAISAILKR